MDPISFGEMLDEMIDWVENGIDKLTEQFPDEVTDDPCLDSVVLDGDASTSALVPIVMAKANDMASAQGIKYCNDLRVRPCINHAAKNCGGKAYEIGHAVNLSCDCPPVMVGPNKDRPHGSGWKAHKGCNDQSHPLVKSYQRGLSAALRGVKDWKRRPGNEQCALSSLAVQGVEEMVNHLSNVHDGPGFVTGERRVCRLHPAEPNGQ
eukprot:220435-Prymnesium_polylepis.1